jgi:hypothetical protein
MPQVRNSFDADRKRDYFSTIPVLTMTSGEGQAVLAPIRRDFAKKKIGAAEPQLRSRVHGDSSTRMAAGSIPAR